MTPEPQPQRRALAARRALARCKHCGAGFSFLQITRPQRYCSRDCKRAHTGMMKNDRMRKERERLKAERGGA